MEFFVRDSGVGIDKKYHKSIFERFRQVEGELKVLQSGSGLGLAISKAYVEMMGGEIRVQSEPGRGSTFSFTVPQKRTENKESTIMKNQTSAINMFDNEVILIAEDDDVNFILVEHMFSKFPVKIIRAITGLEVVEICKNNPDISLVLMDIKMPRMDGLEATRLIKEFRPHLPIIATTAFALSGDKEMSLEAGCDAYISKPMKKDELFQLIQDVKLNLSHVE